MHTMHSNFIVTHKMTLFAQMLVISDKCNDYIEDRLICNNLDQPRATISNQANKIATDTNYAET